MDKEFFALFVGQNVSVCKVRVTDKDIFTRELSGFFPQFRVTASNVRHLLDKYTELPIWNVRKGFTGQNIRLYPFDLLTLKSYNHGFNQENMIEKSTLLNENNELKAMLMDMQSLVQNNEHRDLSEAEFKRRIDQAKKYGIGAGLSKPDEDKKK